MKIPVKIVHTVQFSETDMTGIVHFSNFMKYMEAAESELFDRLGISLIENNPDQLIGWPRVNVSCDFKTPLKFRDQVEVNLSINNISQKSVEYQFEFYKIENDSKSIVGTGKMVTAFSIFDRKLNKLTSTLIPHEILTKLKSAAAKPGNENANY